MTTPRKPISNGSKFPHLTKLFSERSGFRALESNDDIIKLTTSMGLLESAIPSSAKETHLIMKTVSDRMIAECASSTSHEKVSNAISAAVITYSIIRDAYAGTNKVISEAKQQRCRGKQVTDRITMYEEVVNRIRVPLPLVESSNMKTVFSTIFKEIGEIQLEDMERIAKTLPDFDIFLPRRVLDQMARKKMEQAAKRISF